MAKYGIDYGPVFGINCPGCGTELTTDNAGGYRTFCIKCVKAMPPFSQRWQGAFNKRGLQIPRF